MCIEHTHTQIQLSTLALIFSDSLHIFEITLLCIVIPNAQKANIFCAMEYITIGEKCHSEQITFNMSNENGRRRGRSKDIFDSKIPLNAIKVK